MWKGGMFEMKERKKLLSLTLAAALTLGISAPAMAAEGTARLY